MCVCPIRSDVTCEGPITGPWWICPVHHAKLHWNWTELCRRDEKYRNRWMKGIGPGQQILEKIDRGMRTPENPTKEQKVSQQKRYLGDHISSVLTLVGITEDRVTEWLGYPCGCGKRREQLNLLHAWAEKQLRGLFVSKQEAIDQLEELLDNG